MPSPASSTQPLIYRLVTAGATEPWLNPGARFPGCHGWGAGCAGAAVF
jgi:hypothetical protein